MNLLKVLLSTYNQALKAGVVDDISNMKEPNLLPIYHSNKKSANGKDIFVITLTEKGDFIKGDFLPQNEYMIFPVTEESINRTTNVAPHPICDEVGYLISDGSKKNNEKVKMYFEIQDDIKDFMMKHNRPDGAFTAIYKYVRKGSLLQDIANGISQGHPYSIDGYDIEVETDGKRVKTDVEKVVVTFEIACEDGIQNISQNQPLHQLFVDYVTEQNKSQKNQEYCDIAGEKMYCINTHRGVIGKAKLVSTSNHKDTYFGRFSDGDQVIHIGYETSQKIHNMLKYLLDSNIYKHYLGENSYCISWFSLDLITAQPPFMDDLAVETNADVNENKLPDENIVTDDTYNDNAIEVDDDVIDDYDEDDDFEDDLYEEEDYKEPVSIESTLYGRYVTKLNQYFTGKSDLSLDGAENYFCVLILEKSSNGRMSVKFFQSFALADIKTKIQKWYIDLAWPFWDVENKNWILQAPSLKKLINFTYGEEIDKKIVCKNNKIVRNNLERLIPCVLNGRPLPRDFFQTAVNRLTNRMSYPNRWNSALDRGCSLIKKYKTDRGYQVFDEKGALLMENSSSFLFGRLLATYEKLELDATTSGSKSEPRVTNAERLWTAMISRPMQTATLLQRKSMPYQHSLKKRKIGLYVNYDKLLTELYNLIDAAREKDENIGAVVRKEDFVLGYYAQKRIFYTKKDKELVHLIDDEE